MSVSSDLEATAGDADANSYASLEDADGGTSTTGHLEGRLDCGAWESLSDDQKARCLMRATEIIDGRPLYGLPHGDSENSLHWPTTECEDDAGALYIPTEVVKACCEIAATIARIETQSAQLAGVRALGVQSMTEGALSVSFGNAGAGSNQAEPAWLACPAAQRLLSTLTDENDNRGWLIRSAARVVTI